MGVGQHVTAVHTAERSSELLLILLHDECSLSPSSPAQGISPPCPVRAFVGDEAHLLALPPWTIPS